MRSLFASLFVCLMLVGCQTRQITKEVPVYIEKPALEVSIPSKPIFKNTTTWKIDKDGKIVSTSREEFDDFLVDLIETKKYIKSLEITLKSYKDYYETGLPKDSGK